MQKNKPFTCITDVSELDGMFVLVRSSLNVPLVNGVVENTFRLRQSVETIQYLKKAGARVIVIGHVGREPEETLAPISAALQEMVPHTFIAATVGEKAMAARNVLKPGEVLLLENTRQCKEEKANDDLFAQAFAKLADIFVLDAFSDAHREHASIVGVAKYLPTYSGISFQREFDELSKAHEPQPPSLFMIAGAKFETKMPLIEKYLTLYDKVFVAGALANDIFKAKGYEVGKSLVSDVDLTGSPVIEAPHLVIPIDLTVEVGGLTRTVSPQEVHMDEKIMDIGPKTVEMLATHIAGAQTILWNGPFGNYEAGYDMGTVETAKLVAQSDGYSVVGGGDTVAAIESHNLHHGYNFVSTAGGAMLEFLEHGTIAGIEAMKNAPAEKLV